MIKKLLTLTLFFASVGVCADECPAWLDVDVQKLRSDETVNLCELKQDKALLLVNTASQCGFTPQFKGLEALYEKYRDQGFEVVGFPSDSFRQEHDSEEETAKVCYVNYGVTFTMLSTSPVKGDDANPVFAHLASVLGEPQWNFTKYLIARNGEPLEIYNSKVEPTDDKLVADIESALAQ